MADDRDTDGLGKLRHDVRAPLNNLNALIGEMQDVLEQLDELVREHEASLPTPFVTRVHELTEKEFGPLMHYFHTSAEKLSERVNEVFERLQKQSIAGR